MKKCLYLFALVALILATSCEKKEETCKTCTVFAQSGVNIIVSTFVNCDPKILKELNGSTITFVEDGEEWTQTITCK